MRLLSKHLEKIELTENGVVAFPSSVADYDNIIIAIETSDSADMTISFRGGYGAKMPNFSETASIDNQHDKIQSRLLPSLASLVLDVIINADIFRLYQVETKYIDWLAVEVSNHSSGKVEAVLNLKHQG